MTRRPTAHVAARKMRRISGSFWTPKRDEQLRQLEGDGLSAAKTAERLGTTRSAVIGRLHRLSGAALTYPSYITQEKEARARSAGRMKERDRVHRTAITKMQQEIAHGLGRGRQVRPCWQLAMRSGRQRSESGRSLRISPARGTATADLSSCAVALAETLREPKIKSRIEAMQITLQIGGPDVQRKFLADQMKLWGPVVKEHNIKTDS
jgi:GcrA cell cycle regulator